MTIDTAPDLIALLRDYYQASARSDTQFLDRLIARGPGTLVIGTDPGEWWAGGDAIVDTWSAAWRSRGGMPVVGSMPTAFREGNVGWVADRAAWRLPDGRELPFRLTAVFRYDHGGGHSHSHDRGQGDEHERWVMVQAHFSIGVPDE